MRVDAPELVRRPSGQRVMDRRVHAHQDLLSFTHDSRIERAGVDNGRGRLVAAQHDHQVAHHRRFALLVE